MTQEFADELAGKISLDQLGTSGFNALKTIDLSTFTGSAKDLVDAAKTKAVELQDEAWTEFGESRLKVLEKNYNDLEKTIDESVGSDKAKKILELNKNLEA